MTQHIIGNAEGIKHRGTAVNNLQQAVIRNRNQGINLFLQVDNALLCLVQTTTAFKHKRLGNNADGQCANLFGTFCHNMRGTGTSAAAHTGGNKNHICTLECFDNLVASFLSSLFANLRISTGAKALSQLFANLDLCFSLRKHQCLCITVHSNKFHATYLGGNHAVDSVVAAAADTDYLDIG